jgi:hypothetical protein
VVGVRVLPPLAVVDTGRRIGRARGSEPQHPFRTKKESGPWSLGPKDDTRTGGARHACPTRMPGRLAVVSRTGVGTYLIVF